MQKEKGSSRRSGRKTRRDDGRMEIRRGRRKEETEGERGGSLAREPFSRISLAGYQRSAAGRSRSVHEIPRTAGPLPGPFTRSAARRRVLRSRGNEKTGGTLETRTETDSPPDISRWDSTSGDRIVKCYVFSYSPSHSFRMRL